MAPRPYWKGHLKLSLVSCPIALYPAVDAGERVSFRQVNRETGNRLRQQLVDSVTGEVVETHEKSRGYEVSDNQFVVVEEQELERARAEARTKPYAAAPSERVVEAARKHAPLEREDKRVEEFIPQPRPRLENPRTIEIERFIPKVQIDARYHHTPYYIAPRDLVGQEAYAVIRDAMAGKDVVGMGRVILSNRERPIIVEPMGLGLRGMTLRYAHEIRSEAEYFSDIPVLDLPKEMLGVAEHIVAAMMATFDPAYLEDRYRTALVSMLKTKQAVVPPRAGPAVPSRKNVIDLMEVLQRSLAVEQPASRKTVEKPRTRSALAASAKTEARRSKEPSAPKRTKA
jgi:non-homologous end joining protein Ku